LEIVKVRLIGDIGGEVHLHARNERIQKEKSVVFGFASRINLGAMSRRMVEFTQSTYMVAEKEFRIILLGKITRDGMCRLIGAVQTRYLTYQY
jgi:hypothetical protein